MILQPQVLQYWEQYDGTRGQEMGQLTTLVPPLFNQLLVFDPRFPHGVRPVHGTQDPREARLVLHGRYLYCGAHRMPALLKAAKPLQPRICTRCATYKHCEDHC